MKKLAIVGARGHGKVVADAALSSNKWQEVTFFDDALGDSKTIGPWSIEGSTKSLLSKASQYDGVIVAIGNNAIRVKKQRYLLKNNCNIVTIIHSKAVVSPFAEIGHGTVVLAGAIVNAFATISQSCIINTNAVVEHDCIIEDAVHVSPGCMLAGNVKVGESSWIGVGSCVRQGIYIGANVVIGAGGVVVKDIEQPGVYVGNPVSRLK